MTATDSPAGRPLAAATYADEPRAAAAGANSLTTAAGVEPLMAAAGVESRGAVPDVESRAAVPDVESRTAAPGVEETVAALATLRPDLLAPMRAAIPGARAAVLARLWGAFAREPLPGLLSRRAGDGRLEVTVASANDVRQRQEAPRHGEAASDNASPQSGNGHPQFGNARVASRGAAATFHTLAGPADAAEPFAVPPDQFALSFDGRPLTDPGELVRALGWSPRFAAELDNSVANLALARAAQPLSPPPWHDTVDAEQSIIDGHPLHPCCRTRWGMTTADVLAYAPEHRPVVLLPLVAVPEDRWTSASLPPILPMHPWQLAHLRDRFPWLRPTGDTIRARPLMSLRTLATAHNNLKTAVGVQMTSAVRTVSPAALHNGPVLSALLRGIGGVTVMAETGAGAALVDGEPCRSLAFVVREPAPAGAVPLAAVSTRRDPAPFVGELASALLTPLLDLLRRGVALEAHGQNTLVGLDDYRITGIVYRDMGGVRVSPALLRAHGIEAPPLQGDIPTDDPAELRTKVYAAAMVALAERVAVLARTHGVEPARLWRSAAESLRGAPRDLFAPTLPVKATTAMRLAADPLADQWAELPNPLAEHA